MLDENSASHRKSAPIRPFLTGFLAAVALLAAAFLVWQRIGESSVATSSANVASLAALVAEETVKLGVKPHTIALTTDRAMSAADALRRGDYRAAELVAKDILAQSKLQSFSFHPFNGFMNNLSQGDDPKFLEGLNTWISHSPQSALPYLVRAKYYTNTAWLIRGPDFGDAVPGQHMRAFEEFLRQAEDDARRSIALDPNIPWSYFLLLEISGGRDDSQQLGKLCTGEQLCRISVI